jgi:acyl-CoA thioesterase-2
MCDRVSVGDLELDTRVTVVDEGRCVATPSEDWKIWGPMGGYVAAIALRAAATGVDTDALRPASFTCQFLAPARFEPVDLAVTVLRSSRRAAAVSVSMTQDGAAVLEAQTWFAAEADMLEHDHAGSGGAGRPEDHRPISELTTEGSPFPFWENFEGRPIDWTDDIEAYPGGKPAWKQWLRFLPRASFDEPLIEACRLLVLADLPSWPAAIRAYPGRATFEHFVAPSLDLAVQFHRLDGLSDWLLCSGVAPVADHGLIGFRSEVRTAEDRLVASGSGQLLCRELRPPNPD